MKYELLEPIGTGGMATVHRARRHGVAGFERIVALKRIHPDLAATPEYVERFIHEARIGAAFAHPNVIQVIELGRDDRSHFIAMEHLEGWSLLRIAAAAYHANIEIPLSVIVSLLRDLCEALDHIHGHRVIHRDISLGNLFVTRTGHLKLIDFGIATRFGEGDATNEVAGKPSYMSPEAIRGRACDARTDLFSLGVVAWELLTRQKLFDGITDRDTMRAVLFRSPVPPSHHRMDCPLVLDAIVHDLLAKDSRRRTPSAAVLREQLAGVDIDGQPADVARWIAELFGGPVVEVEPEAPTQPSPIVVAAPRRARSWMRAFTAAAIAMLTTAIAWPAAAPASVVEGERITMRSIVPTLEVIETAPEPVVVAPVRQPRVARAKRAAPRAKPVDVMPVAKPVIVAPTPPTPVAIVATAQPAIELPPAPRPTTTTIPPDRVKLLAGAIARVNLARLAPDVRRSFTAVLCIDATGAVTSSKLPSSLPAWLRSDLTRDLATFRFTPHADGPACFARFMKID